MSACISRHGEYSEHDYELGSPVCVMCGDADESAMLAAAWDECAEEAFDWGYLHESDLADMKARNPYRKATP